MGVAAEANRIAHGNWRLSCGAAAFFIHKIISGNGGINMKELWNTAQVIFAAIGGWLGYFLGGCDGLLIALVVFVAVDYLTGVICAVSDKKLSSEVGFKGICRKVLIFLLRSEERRVGKEERRGGAGGERRGQSGADEG